MQKIATKPKDKSSDDARSKAKSPINSNSNEQQSNSLWRRIATSETQTTKLNASPIQGHLSPANSGLIQRMCTGCEQEREDTPIAGVQAKLTVGPANDPYEQEADTVADKVMRMPTTSVPEQEEETAIQTKPLTISPVQRVCYGAVASDNNIQKKGNNSQHNHNLSTVQSVVNSPGTGSRLSNTVRNQVEPVLGSDLSSVRVHSDHRSQKAAADIQAKAFTNKQNIYLGANQSSNDVQLMAHELTHVVQQQGVNSVSGSNKKTAQQATIQRAVRETPQVYQQPGAQVAMVHLHGDEGNALETARQMYGEYCANLVHLNSPRRCITVNVPGHSTPCTADPNRIFSTDAITASNAFGGACSCPPGARSAAVRELNSFRDSSLMPAIRTISQAGSRTLPIVAFHNNTTPGALSIGSYRPGGSEAGATERDPTRLAGRTNPSIAKGEDPDNYLLVNEPRDYDGFSGSRNVVLQATSPTDDGSLSVALRSQRYINIEAQGKRFVNYNQAHFIENKAMADEVFAHLGVGRPPCDLSTDTGSPSGDGDFVSGIFGFIFGIIRTLIRLLSELVRVGGQLSTQPTALPRETPPGTLPSSCLTFNDQAALDMRKGHWDGVIAGMAANTVIDWIIGVGSPPMAATRESRRQMNCLLHAMRASASRRGTTVPGSGAIVSARRDFRSQSRIWQRKFNFDRSGAAFDRISTLARNTCGSLLLATETKWNPREPRHRVCWNAPPLPGKPPPSIPSGARPLTDSERQAEILQASSAPGISRHHWGTDFDLFGVDPADWESGQTFADEYSWLQRNASTYGFIQTFTPLSTFMSLGYIEERWHWSYYPEAQALLDFARTHQTDIQTALTAKWGTAGQFSYIQRHWREFMFNVNEQPTF